MGNAVSEAEAEGQEGGQHVGRGCGAQGPCVVSSVSPEQWLPARRTARKAARSPKHCSAHGDSGSAGRRATGWPSCPDLGSCVCTRGLLSPSLNTIFLKRQTLLHETFRRPSLASHCDIISHLPRHSALDLPALAAPETLPRAPRAQSSTQAAGVVWGVLHTAGSSFEDQRGERECIGPAPKKPGRSPGRGGCRLSVGGNVRAGAVQAPPSGLCILRLDTWPPSRPARVDALRSLLPPPGKGGQLRLAFAQLVRSPPPGHGPLAIC